MGYSNYKRNLSHKFQVGELVQHKVAGSNGPENYIVSKATFAHGHSGYADRWELVLVRCSDGYETKTDGTLVDIVEG